MLDSICEMYLLQDSKHENPFSTVQATATCRNLCDTSGGTADSRSGESPSKGCKAGPGDFHAVLHVHVKRLVCKCCCNHCVIACFMMAMQAGEQLCCLRHFLKMHGRLAVGQEQHFLFCSSLVQTGTKLCKQKLCSDENAQPENCCKHADVSNLRQDQLNGMQLL